MDSAQHDGLIQRLTTGLEALASRPDEHDVHKSKYNAARETVMALRKQIVAVLRSGRTKAQVIDYLLSEGVAASKFALRRYIEEIDSGVRKRKRIGVASAPVSVEHQVEQVREHHAEQSETNSPAPPEHQDNSRPVNMVGLSKEEKMARIKEMARRAGTLRE